MTRDDYLALLRRALSTPHGVALEFDDWVKAERARGRFYRLRSALRRAGDTSFDDLSLVMKPFGGLWIVRRDRLPRCVGEDGASKMVSRGEKLGKLGAGLFQVWRLRYSISRSASRSTSSPTSRRGKAERAQLRHVNSPSPSVSR